VIDQDHAGGADGQGVAVDGHDTAQADADHVGIVDDQLGLLGPADHAFDGDGVQGQGRDAEIADGDGVEHQIGVAVAGDDGEVRQAVDQQRLDTVER
jgi:hypothetical protein